MFLYNGSDAATAVGFALLPAVCQQLLANLETLGGDPNATVAVRSGTDFRSAIDPFELEKIVLNFVEDGV